VTSNVTEDVANALLGVQRYRCCNCDWSTNEPGKLKLIDDLFRVQSGEILGAGECPECSALVCCEQDFIDNNLAYAIGLLRRLGYTVTPP
jgi:hypothetical protein